MGDVGTQHFNAARQTAARFLEVLLSPTEHLANQAIAQFENAKEKEQGRKWRARNDSNVRPSDS
jgi:hypothetical protein